MVLGLGRGRWGLFDALVAEEKKSCVTLGLWLLILRRGFSKTC